MQKMFQKHLSTIAHGLRWAVVWVACKIKQNICNTFFKKVFLLSVYHGPKLATRKLFQISE